MTSRAADSIRLATELIAQKRFEEAEPLLLAALAAARKGGGHDHPDFVGLLHDVAVICDATGRQDEAHALWDEARALLEADGT